MKMNLMQRFKAAMQIIGGVQLPIQRHNWLDILLPSTQIDYAEKVNTGLGSNVFMSPLLFIGRQFPDARLAVITENPKDESQDIDLYHPAVKLLNNPNPFTSQYSLWLMSVIYWCSKGDVYFLKARKNMTGEIAQLWQIPYWMMSPKKNDGQETTDKFVDYYEYTPGAGKVIKYAPEDVIHLKHGHNPDNLREGYSQMYSLLREIFTDDEASNYVAALLANSGVPGVILSPKDASSDVSPAQMKENKEYIRDRFSGDRRGEPLATPVPIEVKEFGYDPKKMDVSGIRNVSEERVCSLLGLPSAVVGFGSGMEQTKDGSTMRDLIKLAWFGCIIPNQKMIAAELTRNLREDFKLAENQRIGFDRRFVSVLQEDKLTQNRALSIAVTGAWMKRSEARKAAGLDVGPEDDVYLVPMGLIEADSPMTQEEQPKPGKEDEEDGEKGAKKNARQLTNLQRRILSGSDRIATANIPGFQKRIAKYLSDFGAAVEEAYINTETPKADDDEFKIDAIFAASAVQAVNKELPGIFGTYFVSIHGKMVDLIAGVGIGVDLPNSLELEILGAGGTRAGLVDMTGYGKERALAIVRNAREQGLGIPEIAKRLRSQVPAGPWSTSKIRAQVIARTETRFAQTNSAMKIYERIPGLNAVQMIDGRLGDTDADCLAVAAMDPVSFAQARQLLAQEHPNGTRDIVPAFDEEAQIQETILG